MAVSGFRFIDLFAGIGDDGNGIGFAEITGGM
jgi:hypothetical protein